MYNYIENASCVIFSRNAALRISCAYTHMHGAGDYQFWSEVAAQGKVVVVHKVLSYFLRHTSTVTGQKSDDGTLAKEDKHVMDWQLGFLNPSRARRRLIESYRSRRNWSPNWDENTQKEMEELWHYSHYQTYLDKQLTTAYRRLVKYLNIHI